MESHERTFTLRTTRLLSLLLASNLVVFFLTLIPVVANLPTVAASPKPGWYSGDDLLRLFEPLISQPLHFLILLESGLYYTQNAHQSRHVLIITVVYLFCMAVYQQGAGFHSASNMHKHTVEGLQELIKTTTLADTNPDVVAYVADMRAWMRDLWQKVISHYIYAAAGIAIAFVQAYLFRDASPGCTVDMQGDMVVMRHANKASNVNEVPGLTSTTDKALWILNILFYGLTVGAVAIEFPSGSIVAFVLCLVWGAGVLGTYLYRKGGVPAFLNWGKFFVLQYFVWSYLVGFVIVIIWVIYAKGFKDRGQAGIKF